MDYIAIIHKDLGSDYGVSFPDFPGCVTAGHTLEEARVMAAGALQFHIEGMREDGETIMPPSSLDVIARHPDFSDGVAFLVHMKQTDKTVRVNITLTEGELQTIDMAAAAKGMKRSTYLVKAGVEAAR